MKYFINELQMYCIKTYFMWLFLYYYYKEDMQGEVFSFEMFHLITFPMSQLTSSEYLKIIF